MKWLKSQKARYIEDYKKAVSEFNLEIKPILEQGLPTDKIISVAREKKADVIIMGQYGVTAEP